MIDDVLAITLVKEEIDKDKRLTQDGKPNVVKKSQVVCAQRMSIKQNEYYGAREKGFKPELCLKVHCFEYNQERICVIDGIEYEIYRTYQKVGSEFVELYLKSDIQ